MINIDKDHYNESVSKICRLIYLPTWSTPKLPHKTEKYQLEYWMRLEKYENSLDRQSEETKAVQMSRCTVNEYCGFFFFNKKQEEFHVLQYHRQGKHVHDDRAYNEMKTYNKSCRDVSCENDINSSSKGYWSDIVSNPTEESHNIKAQTIHYSITRMCSPNRNIKVQTRTILLEKGLKLITRKKKAMRLEKYQRQITPAGKEAHYGEKQISVDGYTTSNQEIELSDT